MTTAGNLPGCLDLTRNLRQFYAMGRPSTYTPELASEICERLADGEALNAICRSEHIPHERSVRRWALDDIEGFAPRYARAREIGMLARGDAVADLIAAEPDVQRARVIFDHERWYLGKMAPKTFGDKLDVAVTGDLSFGERLAGARAVSKPEDSE